MKYAFSKTLLLAGMVVFFAACGNSDNDAPAADTTMPAAPSMQTDTTHADTMINNGERLIGTDTSARQPK